MSDGTKKYVCNLPTNGYQPGQEAWLTDEEVSNLNGGEERFTLSDDQSAPEQADNPADRGAIDEGQTPASEAGAPEAAASVEGAAAIDAPADDQVAE